MISRQDARQAGLVRFFTGQQCKRGHIAERFVSDGTCVSCRAERSLARYHADKETWQAREKAWRTENADKKREYLKKWRSDNPEKVCSYGVTQREKQASDYGTNRVRRWRKENRELVRFHSLFYGNLRRAALLCRTPAWSDLNAIEEVYRDAAEFRQAGIDVDVDHVIPLQGKLVSGLHVPNNLRVCLSSNNRSKSNHFQI